MHLQNIDNIEYLAPLIKEELIKCKQELRTIMDSDAEAMDMVKRNAHLSDFTSQIYWNIQKDEQKEMVDLGRDN